MKHFKKIIQTFAFLFAVAATSIGVAQHSRAAVQVVQPAEQNSQVRVVSGGVEIVVNGEVDVHVTVYALTGQAVKTITATPGVTNIELPKGYYIVKCDNISCRVVVR